MNSFKLVSDAIKELAPKHCSICKRETFCYVSDEEIRNWLGKRQARENVLTLFKATVSSYNELPYVCSGCDVEVFNEKERREHKCGEIKHGQ